MDWSNFWTTLQNRKPQMPSSGANEKDESKLGQNKLSNAQSSTSVVLLLYARPKGESHRSSQLSPPWLRSRAETTCHCLEFNRPAGAHGLTCQGMLLLLLQGDGPPVELCLEPIVAQGEGLGGVVARVQALPLQLLDLVLELLEIVFRLSINVATLKLPLDESMG